MNRPIHVFAGPSLPPQVRQNPAGLVFHPPAAQGDVIALVALRPLAIGIIDGYFERVPAVWHKEILWAMSEGVHVFGASSMGALRAAELAPFGMVGVGRIFEEYVSGRLTDDDEVTLVHADESMDFRPGSEAMVNLRATLALAESQGALTGPQRAAVERNVKELFYPDRSYGSLMECARRELSELELSRLAAWLQNPEHRVDQKRTDALALLDTLRVFRDHAPPPLRVSWTFQHTDAWEQVRQRAVRQWITRQAIASDALARPVPHTGPSASVSAEQAELRALRIQLAKQSGFVPKRHDMEAAMAEFCRARGLADKAALRAFLVNRDIDSGDFERILRDESYARYSRVVFAAETEQSLADLGRLTASSSAPESSSRQCGENCQASLQSMAAITPGSDVTAH
jgi:hypothetical protein